jgi:hypothetical protein
MRAIRAVSYEHVLSSASACNRVQMSCDLAARGWQLLDTDTPD